MNIKPFRLTAGAYLLSKRYERGITELLFRCQSHSREISSRCNSIILFVFFVSTFTPLPPNLPPPQSAECRREKKKKKNYHQHSPYHFTDVPFSRLLWNERKKREGGEKNEWNSRETEEFMNPSGVIGFRKICLCLAAI